MAEYIDRIAFRKHIDDFYPFDKEGQKDPKYDFAKGTFLRLLACFAQADVVERKTGKWIYPSDVIGFGRCSECQALWDYSLMTNKYFKICPRCGSYNGGDEDV